jgi:hypothetical protein
MNLTWLKDANYTTAAKGWSIPALWSLTGITWSVCAVLAMGLDWKPPTEWLTVWTGALVLYSGVNRFEQKDHRETDYGFVERTHGAKTEEAP